MYAIGKVYIYCIKLYAQGVCIMVQFISRRKADFGKAALFVALYACINICLVSLLKEGLYLHGLKGILSGGVIFALAGHFWNYRKRFLAIYAGMMLFLSAGLIIKLIDHVAVGGGEFLGNISLASTIWGSILLVWLCIENAAALTGKIKAGRIISSAWLFISLAILAVPNLVLWGYFALSQHYLRPDIVMTIYQTNKDEAIAYLMSQNPFYIGLAVAAFLLISVLIFKAAYTVCVTDRPSFASTPHGWLGILPMIVLLALGLKTTYAAKEYEPAHIVLSVRDSVKSYTMFAQNKEKRIQRLNALGTLPVLPGHKGIYVLVIGESETRNHMSAYGYQRETTPWLTQFAKEPGTLLFKNPYSNHTHTVPVLTYALSEKNQYNQVPLAKAYSLIEIANAAGFDTYWISNQERYGAWDTPVAEIASTAKHQVWLNGKVGTNIKTAYLDEELPIKTPDLKNVDNALVVFHLMGEHTTYADRYPAVYQKFDEAGTKRDEYDNAVLYTDFVLSRIYDLVKDNPHFQGLVYFSDHGEEPDLGKGHESTKFTNQMSRIPFVVHFSDSYRSANPALFETLKGQENDYWTNDLVYNFMTEIMGIQSLPINEPNLTLGNPAYDRTKDNVRTLHGERKIES